MDIQQTLTTDVLVLGGGLAGLKAAQTAAKTCRVTLSVAGGLCSGSSFYPLMDTLGCQCPTESDGDKEDFLEEINESSLGMNDETMCRYYIDNIRRRVAELPELGIYPKRIEDKKIACFAKRPRDIFYWGDWNGIRNRCRSIMSADSNIDILENTTALCLLKNNGVIAGAVLSSPEAGLIAVFARAVILATGGYGGLFMHNLNTPDVNGGGQSMALLAGASLVNLEFAQFIPGFISPAYKTILREGTLEHCEGLFNDANENILRKALPDDGTYRACLSDRMTHGPFTCERVSRHFDIALFRSTVENRDSKVQIRYKESLLDDRHEVVKVHLRWLSELMHVDILRDRITVAPFFHAANGGILTGHDCCAGVTGLYAAGEAAGGIHGADRHGGNASGSCLVFGALAGEKAAGHARNSAAFADSKIARRQMDELLSSDSVGTLTPDEVMRQIQELLWTNANVVRNEANLSKALAEIENMDRLYDPSRFTETLAEAVKAKHFLILAKAILASALKRRESRGSHYREDYPVRDDLGFGGRISQGFTPRF